MTKSGSRSDESRGLKKREKITGRALRKARAQTSTSEELFPSPFVLRADLFESNHFREKLETVSCSGLMLYFWSLNTDTSDKGSSNFFVSGIDESGLDFSSDSHKDRDHRNTQAGQRAHQTELATFDDVVFPEALLGCLSPSSPYNGPILSYLYSLSLIPRFKKNRYRLSIWQCPPFFEQHRISSGHRSHLYLQECLFFPLWWRATTFL